MVRFTRFRLGVLVGLALLVAFPLANSFASPTGFDVDPDFQDYYEQSGGLPVFGYAVSGPSQENGRLVQYFERQRLELHPEHAGTPYIVLLGHLGWQDAERRDLLDHEAFQPRASGNGQGEFFSQTGHNLAGLFLDYWSSHGLNFGDPGISFRESLALFGYPISEEFIDPKTGLRTQYFERARFEHHPENAGTEYEVLLGHLGHSEVDFLRANGRGPDRNGPPGHRGRGNNNDQEEPAPAPAPEPEPTPEPEPEPYRAPDPVNGAEPATSIQQMVDNASAGDIIRVPAGIYRETVTINKPLTLVSEPGAEIRGSDVWSDWNRSDGKWVSSKTVPAFANNIGTCQSDSPHCQRQEQVFIDGVQLTYTGGTPAAGEFSVNDRTKQIILGENPAGKLVEVSIREHWVTGWVDSVTVDGFTMRHAANRPQHHGALRAGGNGWTVQNSTLSHAAGANISVLGDNANILNNEIRYGGQLGLHSAGGWSYQTHRVTQYRMNLTVRGNSIHHNNTSGYYHNWEAGGIKIVHQDGALVEHNEVHDNYGSGIWFDLDSQNSIVRHNRVSGNHRFGIHYELSLTGTIYANALWENGQAVEHLWGFGAAIHVENSSGTTVRDNVVAWNVDGIVVYAQQRGGSSRPDWDTVTGNQVHNNVIIGHDHRYLAPSNFLLDWYESHDGVMFDSSSNNRGENNRYWHRDPQQVGNVFGWNGSRRSYERLESFNQTLGENNGTYLSFEEVTGILSTNGVPIEPNQ